MKCFGLLLVSATLLSACSTVHHEYDHLNRNHYHPSANSVPPAQGLDNHKLDKNYQVAPINNPDKTTKPVSIAPPGSNLPTPDAAKDEAY